MVLGPYPALRLIERNRTPSFMAFCATAPGDRFNFLAVCVPDSLAFAYARRFRTSSFDHANTARFFFAFAMNASVKNAHINSFEA
jgi:hypothetical protein